MATILITGSTDGLGHALAGALAGRGDEVLVHGRDPGKVADAAQDVRAAGAYVADLSSLEQVLRLAEEVRRDRDTLDVLVNNAGIIVPERRENADGFELGFAVNYLAGFLLTAELLEPLRGSAPGRVVNVASIGQEPIDFDDVMLTRRYDGRRAYAQSKLALVMFTLDLAAALQDTRVTVNAVHPATFMNTKMVSEAGFGPQSTVEEGADAILHLATSPDLEGVSGRFFDGMRESRALEAAYDPAGRRKLRQLTLELVGLSGEEALGRMPA